MSLGNEGNYATAEQIGAFFAGQDLDLVGLQECPADYLAPIAEAAGFEHHASAGVALLSRTPLVDTAGLAQQRPLLRARQKRNRRGDLLTGFSPRPADDVRWSSGAQPIDLSGWAAAIDERTCLRGP